MAELFGYKISKSKEEEGGTSFTAPTSDDGAVDIAGGGFGASYLNTDGREKTDLDLIRRYRDIAQQSECDTAIEDIINEGIVANERDIAVQIVLDNKPSQEVELYRQKNLMKSYVFSSLNKKVMIFSVDGMLMGAFISIKLLTKKHQEKE